MVWRTRKGTYQIYGTYVEKAIESCYKVVGLKNLRPDLNQKCSPEVHPRYELTKCPEDNNSSNYKVCPSAVGRRQKKYWTHVERWAWRRDSSCRACWLGIRRSRRPWTLSAESNLNNSLRHRPPGVAQWIRLRLPSCRTGFECSYHLKKNLCNICLCIVNWINKKRPGLLHFFKKDIIINGATNLKAKNVTNEKGKQCLHKSISGNYVAYCDKKSNSSDPAYLVGCLYTNMF